MVCRLSAEGALIAFMLAAIALSAIALPSGTDEMVVLGNTTASTIAAQSINTTGGSITTLTINGTTQNFRWKAFVGNVTGRLTLDDALNKTIYDWSLTTIQGEVYATRATDITWSNINCSNLTHIVDEENAINHTSNTNDNLSATFDAMQHDTFYVGTTPITEDSCYSLHTYVNSTQQNASFQEIMLFDNSSGTLGNIVYATILEQDTFGYNNDTFDFQLVVPERALSWNSATPYYFYVELQ